MFCQHYWSGKNAKEEAWSPKSRRLQALKIALQASARLLPYRACAWNLKITLNCTGCYNKLSMYSYQIHRCFEEKICVYLSVHKFNKKTTYRVSFQKS